MSNVLSNGVLTSFFVILFITPFSYADLKEENVIAAIDPAIESRLGALWQEQDLKRFRISTNQEYINIVNSTGHRILAAINDRPELDEWKFTVLDGPDVNAFAYPGGKVVVYSGMLDLLKIDGKIDEDMLAAVLGHEIAHVTLHHSMNALRNNASLGWVVNHLDTIEADKEKRTDKTLEKVFAVAQARFTRIQEFEADQQGALYAALAGYHYSSAMLYIQRIIQKLGDHYLSEYLQVSGGENRPGSALDHPTWSERLQGLQDFQKSLLSTATEFNWGVQMLQSQHTEKAIGSFKDVVKVFPNCFQAWNNLGKAYQLQYMQKQGPRNLKFQSELADYFLNLRAQVRGEDSSIDHAMECYRQALRINPKAFDCQANLALALALTHDSESLEEAESIMNKLIKRDPDNSLYLNDLAIVKYFAKEGEESHREALDLFRKATSQNYSAARYNLAILQLEMGNEGASDALREYLKSDGFSSWAQEGRRLLTEKNIDVQPPAQTQTSPALSDSMKIMNIPLGATRTEVIKNLGEPERTERSGSNDSDGGEILWYDTASASFVLANDSVVVINLFSTSVRLNNISDANRLGAPQPEFAGIEIGSALSDLLTRMGDPLQISDIKEGSTVLEKEYSYGNAEVRCDIRLQFSKVRSISLKKLNRGNG